MNQRATATGKPILLNMTASLSKSMLTHKLHGENLCRNIRCAGRAILTSNLDCDRTGSCFRGAPRSRGLGDVGDKSPAGVNLGCRSGTKHPCLKEPSDVIGSCGNVIG